MRTIKFRCYDTVNKKWLWTGFENHVSETFEDKPQHVRKGNFWLTPTWTENAGQVVWQQFTGLKDKNGKEIFEGDIVRSDGGVTGIIKFVDDEATCTIGFYFTSDGIIAIAALTPSTGRILVIIGNIHENPELLTQPAQQ